MKHLFTCSMLAVVFMLYAPPASADPVHDCTSSCWIITCNAATCTVWRCDSNGCREETTFPNNQVNGADSDGPWQGSDQDAIQTSERAVVKVCGPLECSIYGLDTEKSTLLGTFDNLSPAIEDMGREFLENSAR